MDLICLQSNFFLHMIFCWTEFSYLQKFCHLLKILSLWSRKIDLKDMIQMLRKKQQKLQMPKVT